jgi:hypothetical protein
VDLNDNICEFSNGFYFMEYNYFLNLKNNLHLNFINDLLNNNKLNTFKYYEKPFNRRALPHFWIETIKKTMNKNENLFLVFCITFGMFMHTKNFIKKK